MAIGIPNGASMEAVMAVYTRQAAAEFVSRDPFMREGLVKDYAIRAWNDAMPE